MSETQRTWIFHIKDSAPQHYLADEVEEIYSFPSAHPMMVEILMKNGQKHYYPLSEIRSWHLLDLKKEEPRVWTGSRGAY